MAQALFDTNIIIDMSRGLPQALDLTNNFSVRWISAITWMEFMVGVPIADRTRAGRLLGTLFHVVHTDDDICALAVDIRRDVRLKLPDALIYATAQNLGVPLLTRNTKDFPVDLPGVQIPYDLNDIESAT